MHLPDHVHNQLKLVPRQAEPLEEVGSEHFGGCNQMFVHWVVVPIGSYVVVACHTVDSNSDHVVLGQTQNHLEVQVGGNPVAGNQEEESVGCLVVGHVDEKAVRNTYPDQQVEEVVTYWVEDDSTVVHTVGMVGKAALVLEEGGLVYLVVDLVMMEEVQTYLEERKEADNYNWVPVPVTRPHC